MSDTPADRRWRRRKEDRPEEIVAAALDLFAEQGFERTKLDDVARRAGISKGTIYLYFQSKEELFEETVRQTISRRVLAVAQGPAADASIPALDRLGMILRTIAGVLGNPKLVALPKIVIAESGRFPAMARFYRREVASRGLAMIRSILAAGMARGEIRTVDLDVLPRLVIAPLMLEALWRNVFLEPDEQIEPATYVVELHLAVLGRALAPDRPTDQARGGDGLRTEGDGP